MDEAKEKEYTYRLSDTTIAHLVRLIQLGFIQGLDVTDYFRNIVLVDRNGMMIPEEDYLKRLDGEIDSLMQNIPSNITNQEQ